MTAAEPTADPENRRVTAPVTDRVAALTEVVRTLQDERVPAEDIGLRRPPLDEVFLRLTGHRAEPQPEPQPQPGQGTDDEGKAGAAA